MRILFLGDIVGPSGCEAVKKYLPDIIKQKNLDFVVANGENAADNGVGITEKICNELFQCGINVLTTGNHVWDQKETVEYIEREKKLLRPYNLTAPAPGKGFEIFSVIPTPLSAAFSPLATTKSNFFCSIISGKYLLTTLQPDGPTISPRKSILICKLYFQ